MLPSDFPKWQLVYYYFKKWLDTEQFGLLLDQSRGKVRRKLGRKTDPSLGIVNSQSVRWGNNRSLNGFDGNKKVKGIKRHVVVDKNGFLIAVMVSIANDKNVIAKVINSTWYKKLFQKSKYTQLLVYRLPHIYEEKRRNCILAPYYLLNLIANLLHI